MIIMTTYAIGDIPFEDVYLHGLVLDEKGKKMSKSKGNSIDPLVMCDKYGTDAARLSLVMGATPGNDTRLSEEKIAGFRNFVNKLWNVSRYTISTFNFQLSTFNFVDKDLTDADRWILDKMNDLIVEITKNIDEYNFSQAGERLRDFTWNDLADWYLEVSKFEKNESKSAVISYVLVNLLKLWHPFIPFVTEAIWQEMGNKDLLMITKWPEAEVTNKINSNFEVIKNVITSIRNARAENKVEPAKKIKAVIYAGDKREILEKQSVLIKSLRTGIEELEIKESGEKIDDAVFATVDSIEIYLIGAVDKEKEKARLKKEIFKLEEACVNIVSKLTNNEFADRAPENIVRQEKDRLAQYRGELEKLKERLKK
jgi:valyl-tRNA synthetase